MWTNAGIGRLVLLLSIAVATHAASPGTKRDSSPSLPESGGDEKGGVLYEPLLKPQEAAPLPGAEPFREMGMTSGAPLDLAKARQAAERAGERYERWKRLARSGAVSQVELESAGLKALETRAVMEAVRLAVSKADAAGPDSESASATVEEAERAAAAAREAWNRERLAVAQRNVERQRKLRLMGIGSKTLAARAQRELEQAQAAGAEVGAAPVLPVTRGK
jgi:multidrug resistance efflux pump